MSVYFHVEKKPITYSTKWAKIQCSIYSTVMLDLFVVIFRLSFIFHNNKQVNTHIMSISKSQPQYGGLDVAFGRW